ncbi:hypothetical protein [Halanaerobaculum tunisiense]
MESNWLLITSLALLIVILSGLTAFQALDLNQSQDLTGFKAEMEEMVSKQQEVDLEAEINISAADKSVTLEQYDTKTNPFKSILTKQKDNKKANKTTKNKPEGKENITQPKIKFVGVINNQAKQKVIVATGDGNSYILQVGDKINGLEIDNILEDRVRVKRSGEYLIYHLGGAKD